MHIKPIAIVTMLLLISTTTGCGGRRVHDPVSRMPELIAQKQWAACYQALEDSLLLIPASKTLKASEMLKMHPEILSIGLLGYYDDKKMGYVAITCDTFEIKQIFERLTLLKNLGYCSEQQFKHLSENLKSIARGCVESEEGELILDDLYFSECDIYDDDLLFMIFKRQIEQSKQNPQLVNYNLKTYIEGKGNKYDAKLYLFNVLSEIRWITSANSRKIIKSLFPEYYDKKISESKIILFVKTEPNRPLLEMDIIQQLDAYDFIDCFKVNKKSPKRGLLLSVNELANYERQTPERTIQQFVPWHKMSAFSAVLAYPKNSTAIYDLTSGGCSISFAYQIILTEQDEIISEDILRDKEEAEYQYASNLHFKNVFGGIGVPSTYPNSHVKSIFENGSKPINVEDLKNKVFQQLMQRILHLKKIDNAASIGF